MNLQGTAYDSELKVPARNRLAIQVDVERLIDFDVDLLEPRSHDTAFDGRNPL